MAALTYIFNALSGFLFSDQGQSLLRGAFKWIGGILVAKGYFDASMLDTILGVIGTFGGFLQSWIFHVTAPATPAPARAPSA